MSLRGKKVLITAGPTREAIDPVRYISNRSSGKQGYAIAQAAIALGAETILVSGPVCLAIPPGVQVMPVESAEEMLETCQGELPCDIAIFAAAVADWRPARVAEQKMKKQEGGPPTFELVENPDILKTIAKAGKRRPKLVVGFAAETENVIENAKLKLRKKGCDMIVANDVGAETGVFGGDRNKVHIVTGRRVETWPELTKKEVAARLMQKLSELLPERAKSV